MSKPISTDGFFDVEKFQQLQRSNQKVEEMDQPKGNNECTSKEKEFNNLINENKELKLRLAKAEKKDLRKSECITKLLAELSKANTQIEELKKGMECMQKYCFLEIDKIRQEMGIQKRSHKEEIDAIKKEIELQKEIYQEAMKKKDEDFSKAMSEVNKEVQSKSGFLDFVYDVFCCKYCSYDKDVDSEKTETVDAGKKV